ncbi:hypothetical protein HG530_006223 [Fusarium avenaceum]|nr:hypothetical protein HG530_006223 [Fusarium avenaceum]
MVHVFICPVCHMRCNCIHGVEVQNTPDIFVSKLLLWRLGYDLLLDAIVDSAVTVERSNFGFFPAHLARLLVLLPGCRHYLLILGRLDTAFLEIRIQSLNLFVDQCWVMITLARAKPGMSSCRVCELFHACVCSFSLFSSANFSLALRRLVACRFGATDSHLSCVGGESRHLFVAQPQRAVEYVAGNTSTQTRPQSTNTLPNLGSNPR